MADVVLKLPIQPGCEAQLFSRYFIAFVESLASAAERLTAAGEPPFLMLRTDPAAGEEARVVVFQEPSVAQVFSHGWERARRGAAVPA